MTPKHPLLLNKSLGSLFFINSGALRHWHRRKCQIVQAQLQQCPHISLSGSSNEHSIRGNPSMLPEPAAPFLSFITQILSIYDYLQCLIILFTITHTKPPLASYPQQAAHSFISCPAVPVCFLQPFRYLSWMTVAPTQRKLENKNTEHSNRSSLARPTACSNSVSIK